MPHQSRSNPSDPMKSHLSPPRQRLVHLAQRMFFGTIRDLVIKQGEPVFDPLPRIIRRKKCGGNNLPRQQSAKDDFALKQDWVEFFRDIDAIGDGVILLIEVAHGLPFVYEFEDMIAV